MNPFRWLWRRAWRWWLCEKRDRHDWVDEGATTIEGRLPGPLSVVIAARKERCSRCGQLVISTPRGPKIDTEKIFPKPGDFSIGFYGPNHPCDTSAIMPTDEPQAEAEAEVHQEAAITEEGTTPRTEEEAR